MESNHRCMPALSLSYVSHSGLVHISRPLPLSLKLVSPQMRLEIFRFACVKFQIVHVGLVTKLKPTSNFRATGRLHHGRIVV